MAASSCASLQRLGPQIGGGDDPIDQADPPRFGRADRGTREHQLERAALAHEPRQALRPGKPRNQAQVDLRLTESGRVGRQPQRAGHRQLAAAAEREAIDGRDDRLAEVLHRVEHPLPKPSVIPSARWREPGELVDVGAGHERLRAGACQDNRANAGVCAELGKGPGQFVEGLDVEGVQDRRPVDGQARDGAVAFQQEVVKGHVARKL